MSSSQIKITPTEDSIGGQKVLEERLPYRLVKEKLEAAEQQFETTFEMAAVGIALVNSEGRFIRLNKKFCEITGYEHHEISQLTFQQITHPDDLDSDLVLAEQLFAGAIPSYTLNKRYIRKDGSVVWIELTGSIGKITSSGQIYGIAVIRDISRKVELEQKVLERETNLQMILRSTQVAAWDWDPEKDVIYS